MRRLVPVLLLAGCVSTSQDRATDLTRDGLHLYQRGAYTHARDHFQAALAAQPNDADLLYNLARCEEKLNKPAEADRLYQRVLQAAPDHLEARHALLVRRLDANDLAGGKQLVTDWLRRRPNLAGPYIEDAFLRERDNDLDSARARLQQALDLEPRHPRALADLARVYEKLDRPDRAVVLYERSLAALPDQPAVRDKVKQLQARGVSRPRPD